MSNSNTDPIIGARKRIRERFDPTALHKSGTLDGTTTTQTIKLDIVASKFTVSIPSGLTVTITGSIDGSNFFDLDLAGLTNETTTYGGTSTDHLVKSLKFTRTAGTGTVTVAAF